MKTHAVNKTNFTGFYFHDKDSKQYINLAFRLLFPKSEDDMNKIILKEGFSNVERLELPFLDGIREYILTGGHAKKYSMLEGEQAKTNYLDKFIKG